MNLSSHPGGRASARAPIPAVSPAGLGSQSRVAGSPSPRRLTVAWQDFAWRARVIVPPRASRLKPHHTSFTHHVSRFTPHASRNQKHLLRRTVL
jgi:hypothetical protein